MSSGEKDLRPGWVKARQEGRELNWQQKLAERTHGWVRLPNMMTATGVGLTLLSAHYARTHRPLAALVAASSGFLMDAEGVVARRFGVEDPVWGARLDQAADAAKAGIIGYALASSEVMPLSALALTYGPKLGNAAIGAVAKAVDGQEIASSKIGKAAELVRDVVPAAFIVGEIGKQYEIPKLERAGRMVGWIGAAAAAAVGIASTVGYARTAIQHAKRR